MPPRAHWLNSPPSAGSFAPKEFHIRENGSPTATDDLLATSAQATALPLFSAWRAAICPSMCMSCVSISATDTADARSEEHTSELQSQFHLVCRLLLEKNYIYFIFAVCCQDCTFLCT